LSGCEETVRQFKKGYDEGKRERAARTSGPSFVERLATALHKGAADQNQRNQRMRDALNSSPSPCYNATITHPTPFMGNNEEIFKLSDGTVWEVKFEYNYMHVYRPSILVCPQRGFVVVNGKKLNAQKIN